MAPNNHQDGTTATARMNRTAMATAAAAASMNASTAFSAGMLKMNVGGNGSCVTCFGGKQPVPTAIGRPSQVQMEGKKILRALSAFSCISLKTLSSPRSSERHRPLEAEDDVVQKASETEEQKGKAIDQQILLRIVMWGGPNILLILAPVDAPAEFVIEMVLDSYSKGVGLQECRNFELFCAHCNSPALHPKQRIGSVGSRHFLLCKKGLQISGVSIFNSHPQMSQSANASNHSLSSSKYSLSNSSPFLKHSRSLSHGNSILSHSSSRSNSHHRRSNSWWNPVQCLTVGQH
ncbi:unnamed protein product [Calypogeia fissa]